jgi:hypothetical protein
MALTYTAVVGTGRLASDIDAYLYGHTQRAVTIQTEQGVFAILTTEIRAGVNDDVAKADAEYYANYQANRLRSGSFAAWGPEADILGHLTDDGLQYAANRIGANVEALAQAVKVAR